MIFEDEQASEQDRLSFVLHLGDFIYELVWYPEDRATYYDRKVMEIVRYPQGEKIQDFHLPVTVGDYRAVYLSYLHDRDLQDARARWPFVPIWDNHEYSWQGWQALQVFDGKTRAPRRRARSCQQAFFQYQPARMVKSDALTISTCIISTEGGPSLRCWQGWAAFRDGILTLTLCCEKSITITRESRGHYHASVSNHSYPGYRCDVLSIRNGC